MSWLSGYTHRRRLTIQEIRVDSDLVNFPVLVRLTSANFNFANTTTSGNDVRFTAADGTTLLSYERERHDKAGSRAEYWVRVPSVSGTVNTNIFIYFRDDPAIPDGANPTAVWDTNFVGRWALREAGTGAVGEFRDSTVNNNHGQGGGGTATAVPTRVEGRMGFAQNFDGINDFITIPHSPSINISGHITLTAWVRYTVSGGTDSRGILVKDAPGVGRGYGLYLHFAQNQFPAAYFRIGGIWGGPTSNVAYNNNLWHFVAAVYDGSNAILYVNGVERARTAMSGAIQLNTDPLMIGHFVAGGAPTFFTGDIDESSVSNIARTPAWINASFHSGADTLLIYGAEERPWGGGASLLMAMR